MSQALILLEPERQFVVPASGSLIQGEASAINVLKYHLIVPFIRVKNGGSVPSGNSVTLSFQSAAVLRYADESTTGERFVDLGVSIGIGSAAGTYSMSTTSGGGFNAIQNPGALLLWKLTNWSASVANFTGDIWLMCRGF